MKFRRPLALAISAVIALAACSGSDSGQDAIVPVPGAAGENDIEPANAESDAIADAPTTEDTEAATTTEAVETTEATEDTAPETTVESSTTTTSSTTSSTTTTTEPEPELDVFAPECVYQVESGDTLNKIAASYDEEEITVRNIIAENDIEGETIYPDQLLDICVDNGLDDVAGNERERNAAVEATEEAVFIQAQQEKLNQLFAGLGMRELMVDGISGPVTRQRLCAARLGLGLPVSLADMEPGGDEEKALMAAESLLLPYTTALNSERWILIDRTCQVMFVGTGAQQLNFVFPTSTGEEGFETRDQDRSPIFRFDPALRNDGWHNSSLYPVPEDNPLNGNMYKPLYFDGGQAIHGANNVPTTPQSKGCARLRPSDQDALIAWMGLANATGPTGGNGVTVNVQGEFPG